MEREDIEKAAKSYQEKDHDIWTGKGMATELQKAFKAGAEWRINSVWHSTTVIPECYCFVVFLPKKSTIGSKKIQLWVCWKRTKFLYPAVQDVFYTDFMKWNHGLI